MLLVSMILCKRDESTLSEEIETDVSSSHHRLHGISTTSPLTQILNEAEICHVSTIGPFLLRGGC
jgi:hypothetical protein